MSTRSLDFLKAFDYQTITRTLERLQRITLNTNIEMLDSHLLPLSDQ